ncbi:hypothetical protein FT663_04246 [Candidozyma haemuli var. vulneris]|uniref:Protein RTA1 n=1 Tax=Candidozyma haemuli TaxID=45357 RepID=A0A2V1ASD8_9ASCO|nr:hypothetical protein CXQ85_004156 [[Candida] haemuloni]KAF3987904.1 hypothetical protein FT662_03735 [[Candida] haemuloni var. vulneris]KAF3987908.1 hypothetical protein FT663_04246 [[Candida] haemuloni var. vulneris]PVH20652.1 hypothetical protein CXQ85_004156 [[Candida] haemuloni]
MAEGFENWRPYEYTPSIAAAIIFTILFTAVTAYAFFQFFKALRYPQIEKLDKKRTLIIIPFLVGGVCEIVGCIGRCVSSQDEDALAPFIMQSTLLLVAPALFAATIYMILGRVIAMLNSGHQSLIPLKWLTKIFVLGDVISFLMQGSGAGIMSSGDTDSISLGETIVIIGLFVQIGFFSVFIIVTGLFQLRVWKEPSLEAQATRYTPTRVHNWQMILVTLFACSLLILVRCIIRAIEYIQGWDGYIISHEVFLYTLDLLLMFLNMVLLCWQDICGYFVEVGPQTRDANVTRSLTEASDPFKEKSFGY